LKNPDVAIHLGTTASQNNSSAFVNRVSRNNNQFKSFVPLATTLADAIRGQDAILNGPRSTITAGRLRKAREHIARLREKNVSMDGSEEP
jgi:hypothetical protein